MLWFCWLLRLKSKTTTREKRGDKLPITLLVVFQLSTIEVPDDVFVSRDEHLKNKGNQMSKRLVEIWSTALLLFFLLPFECHEITKLLIVNRMVFFTLDWIQFGFPFLEKQGATFTQTHQLLGRFQLVEFFRGCAGLCLARLLSTGHPWTPWPRPGRFVTVWNCCWVWWFDVTFGSLENSGVELPPQKKMEVDG